MAASGRFLAHTYEAGVWPPGRPPVVIRALETVAGTKQRHGVKAPRTPTVLHRHLPDTARNGRL